MKVIVIGATGTIGKAVVQAVGESHEIVHASLSKSAVRVDISDKASISEMFGTTGRVDAVICAAGVAKFGLMRSLTDDDFALSVRNKMMGQVNLVRAGRDHLNDKGSITLTSGILSRMPVKGSAAISMVNSAIEGFGKAAALEMPRGIRLNVVSPNWVVETLRAFNMDTSRGTPSAVVAKTYVNALEGSMKGEVLDAVK